MKYLLKVYAYAFFVSIDADLCTGCSLCVDTAPEVFKMADDIAEVITVDVPAEHEAVVKESADDCPAEAISGAVKKVHTIDPNKCIKCGICFQICPTDEKAVYKMSGG